MVVWSSVARHMLCPALLCPALPYPALPQSIMHLRELSIAGFVCALFLQILLPKTPSFLHGLVAAYRCPLRTERYTSVDSTT